MRMITRRLDEFSRIEHLYDIKDELINVRDHDPCSSRAVMGVKTVFLRQTLAKTEVSRHETSRDMSDLVDTRRD